MENIKEKQGHPQLHGHQNWGYHKLLNPCYMWVGNIFGSKHSNKQFSKKTLSVTYSLSLRKKQQQGNNSGKS